MISYFKAVWNSCFLQEAVPCQVLWPYCRPLLKMTLLCRQAAILFIFALLLQHLHHLILHHTISPLLLLARLCPITTARITLTATEENEPPSAPSLHFVNRLRKNDLHPLKLLTFPRLLFVSIPRTTYLNSSICLPICAL